MNPRREPLYIVSWVMAVGGSLALATVSAWPVIASHIGN